MFGRGDIKAQTPTLLMIDALLCNAIKNSHELLY